ncbi:MAG: hypothetical protein JWM11_4232 [Planctomycetaceae bacterium]|nr:hypothetical protein [Planctomycetaceae bacterium]
MQFKDATGVASKVGISVVEGGDYESLTFELLSGAGMNFRKTQLKFFHQVLFALVLGLLVLPNRANASCGDYVRVAGQSPLHGQPTGNPQEHGAQRAVLGPNKLFGGAHPSSQMQPNPQHADQTFFGTTPACPCQNGSCSQAPSKRLPSPKPGTVRVSDHFGLVVEPTTILHSKSAGCVDVCRVNATSSASLSILRPPRLGA